MPVETPSLFAKVIQDHLELKERNSRLEDSMPLGHYKIADPFDNHPLFKTEEQARLEETMDGAEPAVAATSTGATSFAARKLTLSRGSGTPLRGERARAQPARSLLVVPDKGSRPRAVALRVPTRVNPPAARAASLALASGLPAGEGRGVVG